MFLNFIFTAVLLSVLSVQLCTVSAIVGMDAELDESSVDDVVQCDERIVLQS